MRVSLFLLVVAFLLPTAVRADEGQWPPAAFVRLDPASLKAKGFELAPSDFWSAQGGLARAAINYGGCSAAFVSKSGLIATNHHCAYQALQAASTVEHDYLKDGFVAPSMADELHSKGRGKVWVIDRIVDVTSEVRAAIDGAEGDEARRRAADARALELSQACEEARPGFRCDVKGFFFGARWERHELLEIRDVRLVYAPPSAIGEYGGEIDNWMWPRHTGDFALLRAYVGPDGQPADYGQDNKPFTPKHVFAVGHEGVEAGDFVAVLGFPGRTNRYLWASALAHHAEVSLPARVALYQEWLAILMDAEKRDRSVALKVASLKKRLANVEKNSRGMQAGIGRMRLLTRRRSEAAALETWATEKKDSTVAEALRGLDQITAAEAKTFARDHLLRSVHRGPRMLGLAIDLVRLAAARQMADRERRPRYQTRNLDRLRKRLVRVVADYDLAVEAALLASWLRRVEALPASVAVPTAAGAAPGLSVNARARAFLEGTSLRDAEVFGALFDEASPDRLAESQDTLLGLARVLAPSYERLDTEAERRQGVLLRVAPDYRRAVNAVRQGPVYPDANGTLRVSYAQVQGYAPRDGLLAVPFTTLAGQVAKHSGKTPFDLPQFVRDAAGAAGDGYFAHPDLEDVPVCFLSNADTTGGNSGSPVVDGRGRWVGLNFDRVWENIAGDVAYNPPQSRNITVDVRYLLWLLSETSGAERLLDELGVGSLSKRPRRFKGGTEISAPRATSCATAAGSSASIGALALALAIAWISRRTRGSRSKS